MERIVITEWKQKDSSVWLDKFWKRFLEIAGIKQQEEQEQLMEMIDFIGRLNKKLTISSIIELEMLLDEKKITEFYTLNNEKENRLFLKKGGNFAIVYYLFSITGDEVENLLEQLYQSMYYTAILDVLRNNIREIVEDMFALKKNRRWQSMKKSKWESFGPGYKRCPVNRTKEYCDLLQSKEVEVVVENGMLRPEYSCVGSFAITEEKMEEDNPCMLCLGKQNCMFCMQYEEKRCLTNYNRKIGDLHGKRNGEG